MGTRHCIIAVCDGEHKIAQYGQWDGYPTGLPYRSAGMPVHRGRGVQSLVAGGSWSGFGIPKRYGHSGSIP